MSPDREHGETPWTEHVKNHTLSLCKYYNKLLYLFKHIVPIISFISFHGILSLDYPYIIATSGYINNAMINSEICSDFNIFVLFPFQIVLYLLSHSIRKIYFYDTLKQECFLIRLNNKTGVVFVSASNQTGLDTRLIIRKSIIMWIRGEGRSGTSWGSSPACLCWSSAHLVHSRPAVHGPKHGSKHGCPIKA